MSHKRRVWQEISELAARMAAMDTSPANLSELSEQLGRLGKVQFKATTLAEAQAERWDTALDTLQQAVGSLEQRRQEAAAVARRDLLAALLPVLDGLEAALSSGENYMARSRPPDREATASPSFPAETLSPTDPAAETERAVLAGWLEGLRLVRQRMLALLAEAGVKPIPTVGHPFDPYQHVAVGVVEEDHRLPGTIVAEQRRGYTSPAGVLRYAEVIVVAHKQAEESYITHE